MSSETTIRAPGPLWAHPHAAITGWARGLALWVLSLLDAGLLLALPLAIGQAVDTYFTSRRGFSRGLVSGSC